jgi:hypothetical protein
MLSQPSFWPVSVVGSSVYLFQSVSAAFGAFLGPALVLFAGFLTLDVGAFAFLVASVRLLLG